jgi:hypothetical protein
LYRYIMAGEGINPERDVIKAAYVVPKGHDGVKMAPLGNGVYRLSTYMSNDEWGYALLFSNGKLFAEIGSDESSTSDAGKGWHVSTTPRHHFSARYFAAKTRFN